MGPFQIHSAVGSACSKAKAGKKIRRQPNQNLIGTEIFLWQMGRLDPCSQISKSRWLLVKVRCYQCMHVIHVTSWKTAAEQVDKHILFRVVPLCPHVLILKIERHRQMCGMHPPPPKNETNWCKSTRIFWNGSGLAMFWPTWRAINIWHYLATVYSFNLITCYCTSPNPVEKQMWCPSPRRGYQSIDLNRNQGLVASPDGNWLYIWKRSVLTNGHRLAGKIGEVLITHLQTCSTSRFGSRIIAAYDKYGWIAFRESNMAIEHYPLMDHFLIETCI